MKDDPYTREYGAERKARKEGKGYFSLASTERFGAPEEDGGEPEPMTDKTEKGEEMLEKKEVWVAMSNTDRTEGRGKPKIVAYSYVKATAYRLGMGKGVQGSDCPVMKRMRWVDEAGQIFEKVGRIAEPTGEDLQQNKCQAQQAIDDGEAYNAPQGASEIQFSDGSKIVFSEGVMKVVVPKDWDSIRV